MTRKKPGRSYTIEATAEQAAEIEALAELFGQPVDALMDDIFRAGLEKQRESVAHMEARALAAKERPRSQKPGPMDDDLPF